jgi:DNA-binding transcriptional MerR regulator
VATAQRLLFDLGVEDPQKGPFELKDRLVRYYTAEGALDRPGREGKEARYDYRHLVQLMVTRWLVNDGWPVAKAAEFIRSRDLGQLEAMLPDYDTPPRQRTRAERAIDEIRHAGSVYSLPQESLSKSFASHRRATDPDHAEGYDHPEDGRLGIEERALLDRARVEHVWRALGHEVARPDWKDTASIDLTPWCAVTVDADSARKATLEDIELLGEALVHALKQKRMTRRERK